MIGYAWLQWLSDGVYAGLRRIELNCQIDDMFMATGGWNSSAFTEGRDAYRLTTSDLMVCYICDFLY